MFAKKTCISWARNTPSKYIEKYQLATFQMILPVEQLPFNLTMRLVQHWYVKNPQLYFLIQGNSVTLPCEKIASRDWIQGRTQEGCLGLKQTSLENTNMTSNCDVTNSAHQIQITTICRWMKPPPWKFSAYATDWITDEAVWKVKRNKCKKVSKIL